MRALVVADVHGHLPALEAVQPTYPAYGEVRCADEDGAVTMSPEAGRPPLRRWWGSGTETANGEEQQLIHVPGGIDFGGD